MKKFYNVKSTNGQKKYSVWIDTETNESSCTCVYSSLYGVNKKVKCKHIKEVLECLKLARGIEEKGARERAKESSRDKTGRFIK